MIIDQALQRQRRLLIFSSTAVSFVAAGGLRADYIIRITLTLFIF